MGFTQSNKGCDFTLEESIFLYKGFNYFFEISDQIWVFIVLLGLNKFSSFLGHLKND